MPLGDLPPKLQLQPAITPTELFQSGDGQPCAHPCTLQGHTLPVFQERCSHTAFALQCVHEGSCATCPPLSSGTPRAALSLLASPTALSHRAELSQGRGTDRTSPLAQQMHAVVLS